MRDLLIAFIIFGSLPAILVRPYIGILLWTWISLMSPHRLAWGFAYDFPFAKVVGATTILAAFLSGRRRNLPITRETGLLALFNAWMVLTTLLALVPESAWEQWFKVSKIQLLILITVLVITDRIKLHLFVWMIVLSVGFYGIKGGIFTILHGGGSHVLGPPGSFIEDNNHLGLALIILIPLMRYLQLQHRGWIHAGLGAAMILTGIAVLGTQSRGAFIGIVAMLVFMAWKSRRRVILLLACVVVVPLALAIMPSTWYQRIDSISDYRNDTSAMGRINAWGFAVRVAMDRPLVGGGFNVFTPKWFSVYAPDPTDFHDAHSIYFEVLGEHGFVGIAIFLAIGACTWLSCSAMAGRAAQHRDTLWIADLAKMCQVALIGYAVTGMFVGLAYFDLYYNVIAIVVIARMLLAEQITTSREDETVSAKRHLGARLAPAR